MKRRKFIRISTKGTLAMSAVPVVLDNSRNNVQNVPQPVEGYLPEYTRTVKAAKREIIQLITDFPEEAPIHEWPVTFGVPFPRGAVTDINSIRIITNSGEEVSSQKVCTARWHSSNGDIKWVLFDINAKRENSYLLEYGTEVKSLTFASPLKVKEDEKDIIIETGPLRIAYNRKQSFLPAGAWLLKKTRSGKEHWIQVISTAEKMYMTDHLGEKYTTSDKPDDYNIEIEEQGAQRITVKISGYYCNKNGKALCKYVTRIHHFAGKPYVKMSHTFIIAFDTDKIFLRDIAIPLKLHGGTIKEGSFQNGTGWEDTNFQVDPPCFLIQETARKFVIKDESQKIIKQGKRAGAWVTAKNKAAGLTVGVRNFWQEYPRELEINSDGIIVHLWPLHSENLMDLGARNQLGPRYNEWDKVYWENWYIGGLDQYDQAFGLAKTSELMIAFHLPGDDTTKSSQDSVTALENPPFIHVNPEWISFTDVFGPFQPLDRNIYPQAENVYDAVWDHFYYLRENIWNHENHIGNYGFFDYGDVNYDLTIRNNRWEPSPWRRMASRFYGICILPWLHYVRSSERRHLQWAIDNARHVMDIDMCHLTGNSDDWIYPKYSGGRYGGNGGIIHYGGNIYGIGPDSHVAHLKYFYYLTGDRRAWDVLCEEGKFYLENEASGLKELRKNYAHRSSGGALCAMIDLWNATWDKRYLEAAKDIAATFYAEAERSEIGITRCDDVYINRGMVSYYQATGDKKMKDLFLHNMRHEATLRIPTGDPRAFTGYGPAMAFYFTGDPSYLNRPKFLFQQYLNDVNLTNDPLLRGTPEERWPMANNTVHMIYGTYLLKALTECKNPIIPAGDLASTNGEIWINNPEGKSFKPVIYWSVLSRPFYQGIEIVREWPAYAYKNRPESTIQVLDPGGDIVKEIKIDYAKYMRYPYNSQDYPFSGQLQINISGGKKGLYRIVPAETGGVYLNLALLDSDDLPWVLPIDRGGISHGPAYYFHVPKAVHNITLHYKFLVYARKAELKLFDQNDKLIETRLLHNKDLPSQQWEEWNISIPESRSGELFKLEIFPSLNKQQILYLKFDDFNPVVSLSPKEYFIPASLPVKLVDLPLPLPASLNNEPKILSAGDKIIFKTKQTVKSNYGDIDYKKGTMEFWIKPDWDVTDFQDVSIFCLGEMILLRRSQRGTYLKLSKEIFLVSGFILMPNHWYHLAITWDITISDPFLRLYINKTKMAAAEGPVEAVKLKNLKDWASGEGIIGGTEMTLANIQILKFANDKELLAGE